MPIIWVIVELLLNIATLHPTRWLILLCNISFIARRKKVNLMYSMPPTVMDSKKEECQIYIKQTKLFMTLTSAFLFAPVALVMILKDKSAAELDGSTLAWFVAVEILFACSVLSGYIALNSLFKSQDNGSFDAFCKTTRLFSVLQFRLFVAGIVCSAALAVQFIGK